MVDIVKPTPQPMFSSPLKISCLLAAHPFLWPSPRESLVCFLSLQISFYFLEFCINGNKHGVPFLGGREEGWVALFGVLILRFICLVACIRVL